MDIEKLPSGITVEESARRRRSVDYGIASVGLEGLPVAADARMLFERFVAGELTSPELTEAIKALFA